MVAVPDDNDDDEDEACGRGALADNSGLKPKGSVDCTTVAGAFVEAPPTPGAPPKDDEEKSKAAEEVGVVP